MANFVEMITKINGDVNSWVWGPVMLVFLVGTGIFLTLGLKFFQISKLKFWMKNTFGTLFTKKGKKASDGKSISSFQALCTALAATIGVGNIAGVAAAIVGGGPGAVFWMWIAAFLGMMTNYSENVLGIYYRRKNADGEWSGGAMYYLRDGLGKMKGCKWLGGYICIHHTICSNTKCVGIIIGVGYQIRNLISISTLQ